MIRSVLFHLLISLAGEKVCSAWFWKHFFALSKSACGGLVRGVRHFVQPWLSPCVSSANHMMCVHGGTLRLPLELRVLFIEHASIRNELTASVMHAGMSAISLKPMLTGIQLSWSAILGEWRHPRIPCQHHCRMRMAVSVMIKAQDEGPTWAWFCVAPDVPAGKLWWVAWCAGRLLDHTSNDVAQKPQTCDVIWSSMGEVRLWRGASYKFWNDDFWLENTCQLFDLQNTTNLAQWDSYTWSDESCRDLDIMRAASLEWPLAPRMARRVSMRVDLTAGSTWRVSVTPSPIKTSWVSSSWPSTNSGIGSSWDRSINSGTTKLPVAVERSETPSLLVTEQSCAELEGLSWMAGKQPGGPSRCPRALTWCLSTLPCGPDTAIRTWWVVCWRMSQTNVDLRLTPLAQTRVADAPWPSSTPYSVSGRLWTGNPPGCCAFLTDGREPK